MTASGAHSSQEISPKSQPPSRWGLFLGWLRTPTGVAVGTLWLALLVAACVVVRARPLTVVVEVLAMLFGLYATSVAFRKERTAGLVILIALTFTFLLLNIALYLPTLFPNPMGR